MVASRPGSYLVIHAFTTLLVRAHGSWQTRLSILSDLDLNPGAQLRLENLSIIVFPDEVELGGHEGLAEARIFLASLNTELECELFDEIDNAVSEIEALHEQLATLLRDKGISKKLEA